MTSTLLNDALTGEVIGHAIDIHKELGPDLKERAYEEALEIELTDMGLKVNRQLGVPLRYKGVALDVGFRVDLLVNSSLVLELKSVETIHPVHEAQLLTYLRLGRFPLGLLFNFNTAVLKDGIRRKIQSKNWVSPDHQTVDFDSCGDEITAQVVLSAFEVHRNLGPGLLPSVYDTALCHELATRNLPFERQVSIPLSYKDKPLTDRASIPLVVNNEVPVFCYCDRETNQVHRTMALARIRQGDWKRGLILNFHQELMKNGIVRISN